jgi:hypothetical protein
MKKHSINGLVAWGAVVFVFAVTLAGPTVELRGDSTSCRVAAGPVALGEVPEASGVAVSRRSTGVLWAINDSGQPLLFALDPSGAVKGKVRVAGAAVDDWEDVTVGPCPGGSCIYVADIGDNNARRSHVTIYRVPEPSPQDAATAAAEVFRATYPDGPQDAEAFFVTDAGLFIVTKGHTGPVALYRFPSALRSGATVRLERVGSPRAAHKANEGNRITGAASSPDGHWIALRAHDGITFFRAEELVAGHWQDARHVDLRALRERQGEGVAIGPDNTVYLVGEGGGHSRPGTLARLNCTLGQ